MRKICTLGVWAVLCAGTMAMASTQEQVPVREGDSTLEVPAEKIRPAVRLADSRLTEGVPVPVGKALDSDSRSGRPRHPVATSGDAVPVDDNPRAQPEKTILSGAAPSLMDDHYVAEKNVTLAIAANVGFLTNDYDPEGDSLVTTLVTNNVDHGSVLVYPDGHFSYVPDLNYVGADFFDVRISDGTNSLGTSRIFLTVVESDRPPVAQNDLYMVAMNEVLQVPAATGLLLNDFDPDGESVAVTVITNNVDHGSLSVFPDGRVTYTPDSNFSGTDSFSYRMGANGFNATAVATITVYDSNRAPYAELDNYFVPTNGTLSVPAVSGLLRNDFDPDGDSIAVNLISDGADHGSLSVFPDGRVNYTPNSSYSGIDRFTYRMSDGNGAQVTAIVTIFVGVTTDPASAVLPPIDKERFGLSLPKPNPFNPSTQLDFRVDGTARTTLRIFDIRGYMVKALVDEDLPTGDHVVHWDGTDSRGLTMASGTYFATLSNGSRTTSQRLALVK